MYSMTLWPRGLKRKVKAVVLVGTGTNPTGVTFPFGFPITLLISYKFQDNILQNLFTPNSYVYKCFT